MLRRPATTIQLTQADIEAYEANRQRRLWEKQQAQSSQASSQSSQNSEKSQQVSQKSKKDRIMGNRSTAACFLAKMSHRTAAAALLLASLPYGLALPQVFPLVSELAPAPNVTPSPLSLVSTLNASSVTVVGTIVQPAVKSAVEDITDAIEDTTATVASALESATDAVESAFPTDAPSILDPEANILPLILPGILPVETELPPVDIPDAVPSGLPEDYSLEVIDLPTPSEVPPGDDSLISEPYFPDFPDEATVPISTFNAVVQPLLSVIQTLLNSLPGNFAPPLPGILPHPLLPTETPEIFIDPLLPTETFSDTIATTTDMVDPLVDPLVDPIPTNSIAEDLPFTKRQETTIVDTNSILALLTPILEAINALIAQIPVVGPAASDAVSEVEAAVTELPVEVPALPIDAPPLPIPDITLPNLPLPPVTAPDALPTDNLPVDVPAPALPELPLTTPPALPDLTSGIPDEVLNVPIPDDVQGIDWAAFESPPFSDIPAPSLDDVAIPDDILNIPVPDFDENGLPIDTPVDAVSGIAPAIPAALPISFDAAVADATTAVPAALPTSLDAFGDLPDDLPEWPFPDIPETFAPDVNGELPDLQDFPIPDDVLNVPVPDLDNFGVPLDLPTEVAGLLLPNPAPTLALPTDLLGLAAPTELADLVPTDVLDVPVPTDLLDVPVPTDVLDVPVPTDLLDVPVPTELADAIIPTDSLDTPIPTGLLDVPVPTDLFDIPVPEGFEDIAVPADVVTALPAAPSLGDVADIPIPDDILNIPWPDLDENGIPIDLPVDPADGLAAPPAALPTDLNWWDIPVPDDWVDVDDVASILPAPAAPTDIVPDALPVLEVGENLFNSPIPDPSQNALPIDLPAPALPTEAFGAGFPIQAFPDIPLVLPTVSDVASQLPADDLLPIEGPAALTGAFTDVPTDALSGLPTSDLADVLPAVPAVTGLSVALPALSVPTDILAAAPSVAAPTLPAAAAPTLPIAAPALAVPTLPAAPAIKLPLQVPGARGPLGKRQLPNFLAPPKSPSKPSVAATAGAVKLLNTVLTGLSNVLSSLLAELPGAANAAPKLPSVNSLVPSLPLPSLPVATPDVAGIVGGIVSTLPAPDVASLVPSLAVPDVAAILPAIIPDASGLVGGVASSIPNLPSVLPELPGLSDVATPAVPSILPAPATLPGVVGLAGDIVPSLAVPDVPGVLPAPAGLPDLNSLVGVVAPAVAVPDVASILPAPADLSVLGGVASPVTGAVAGLPVVGNIAPTVTGLLAGGAPALPDAAGVASTVTGVAPAVLLSSLGGQLKKRRASELFQQGPASDWESFIGELDESKQPELARLIHDSAKAVNNDDLDNLAYALQSDFDDLSDETKSALMKGFGATTIGKRSMRYAKRQDFAVVPGVQSIGPNLDDALKIDVSGFNLDPNNQLNGLAAGGTPVDSNSPPSFQELDGPVASLDDPELLDILASGGLDPNGMLGSPAGVAPVDDVVEDPYADIRQNLEPSFAGSKPLEGLDATLQAAKDNRFSGKNPRLSWVPTAGGSAAAQQAEAAAKQQAGTAATQQQGNVLQWFQRFVKPSWNKDVDAEIVR
ncbi:hypothetical protein E8E12_011328 [Didymella heteroderae]|uniref:Uncharacterized protein n=1 Tax=Didymella heteroderae TaxID=1769908 RepID=A0A9P4X057_9PLEO|nr:hypothetical protein E8E12_011328 [Didymella heteroderae]